MSGTVRSAESAASMSEAKLPFLIRNSFQKRCHSKVIEAAKMAKEGEIRQLKIIDRPGSVLKSSQV